MIITFSLSNYISDMILSSKILKWDAIMTFLQVSNVFRTRTIELLYHLWGEALIHDRKR